MPKLHHYVGPREIAEQAASSPLGTVIASAADVLRWAKQSGSVTATFMVDPAGLLLLADRRSEHIACAGGGPVLAAGEIAFQIEGRMVSIEAVTNQSTGYCPEPESWPAVAAVLEAAAIAPPDGYITELVFRRCPGCDQINVVKEQAFECAVCGAALPLAWNLGGASAAPRTRPYLPTHRSATPCSYSLK